MATAPEETTRDRLIAAAIEVFEAQGYEGARVQDIARAAGMTTGAIYANYRDKRELLFAAMGTRVRLEVDDLAQGGGRDARAILEQLGANLPQRGGGPSLLLDAMAAARRDPELAAVLRAGLGVREEYLVELLARAKDDGSVSDDLDPDATARFALMLAMGALVLRNLDVEPPNANDWQALIHRVVGAFAPEDGGEGL
jgi:AcrR family transcriptional regulator